MGENQGGGAGTMSQHCGSSWRFGAGRATKTPERAYGTKRRPGTGKDEERSSRNKSGDPDARPDQNFSGIAEDE